MCGIAGIAGLENSDHARETVAAMTRAVKHRGPDADGIAVFDGAALGQARLSIIDLSAAADQPMADSANRFIITFNGEIYNYREIRERLHDYPFRTNSDTETILAAYRHFGPECLQMLNGMFALAIWDREKRVLFAARDRLGVKPFYYSHRAGVFAFASEIRALLPGIGERKKLPAGSYAYFSDGELSVKRYWSAAGNPDPIEETDAASVGERVLGLLRQSVKRRLVSDVGVGAFLSGGIDSSAIVALMAETSPDPVHTFSVTFEEPEYDESTHSDTVAAKFGTSHTSVRLTADDFLAALPAALAAADSPSGDGLNTFVVSRATREAGLKVAMSGVGGDELFAGYPNFLQWLRYREGAVSRAPAVLRRAAGSILSRSSDSKFQRIGSILGSNDASIAGFYPRTRQILADRIVEGLTGTRGPTVESIAGRLSAEADEIGRFPLLSQFSIAELTGYTQNVLLKDADQFSMASALEVREPFFDFELVEYVLRIPDRFKYPVYPKKLLVEALAPRLPDSIVHRKKMGFVLPFDRWMRTGLREFCEERLANLSNFLEPKSVERLWRDFLGNRSGVLWSHVWHLVVLSDWLNRHGVRD